MVHTIGADRVIDHIREDFTRSGQQVRTDYSRSKVPLGILGSKTPAPTSKGTSDG
jgi:hypothetical protein